MRINAKQIAECTGGQFDVDPLDPRALIGGLTWDSREVASGDLYVALPGERTDGHAFVGAALRSGAACALVSQPPDAATRVLAREMGAAIIEVPSTPHALTDLARWWRTQLHGRVIGVTGSSGKTTTKNLIRDVLSARFSVVATQGNQNNELGVPKTILSADVETEAVIVEMGMRGRGQIAELCDFVRPDWGVIVNVGESHIELLGSREEIARAKAELVEALPAGTGCAFLNGADDYCGFVRACSGIEERHVRAVTYDGSGRFVDHREAQAAISVLTADGEPLVWAESISFDDQGRPSFTLCASGFAHPAHDASADEGACRAHDALERVSCSLKLRGAHNVSNACAAAAVGRACGMTLAQVATALSAAEPEAGRQEVLHARGGFSIVNDAYNANPDSMRASLRTFSALAVPGRRIAVLGDMLELGDHARACHEEIGRLAAGLPLDTLICVGELSAYIAQAACDAGMDPDKIIRASSTSDVLGELDVLLEPGDAVLIKASHSVGLSRVVEGLVS